MKKFVHGGNVYDTPPNGGQWLDFSVNINPLGLAPAIAEAIRSHVSDIVHYPDILARELKEALANYYDIRREQLVLGNGAAELFYVWCHAVKPRKILLPVPSFSEYERAALAIGAKIDYFPLDKEWDFQPDIEALVERLPEYDALFIGNPNNPTGNLIDRAQMAKLLRAASESKTYIVTDESFLDFLVTDENYTALSLLDENDNLVVFRSLTKFYAIPGLRLGFGAMAPELAARLDAQKDPWNVNLLAHHAGVAALGLTDYQKNSRDFLVREKEYLAIELSVLDGRLKVFPPSVNFILLDLVGLGINSETFVAAMRDEGILVRDCANYPGLADTFVRVAVRRREDNEKLLAAMKKVLREVVP